MKFHETITENWNPLIMRVLANSVNHPESILFGVTGDIDNLGIYVAKNGRAKAENLVDLYNQIIRNEIVKWAAANQEHLDDYTFVASGEEIFILGLARERALVDQLFREMNLRLNRLIRDNRYIDIGETGITFGCATFDNDALREKICHMVNVAKNKTGGDEYVCYLEVMETMRDELARELDKVKFSDLNLDGNGSEILLRNFVYIHLLDYKYDTARALKSLAQFLRDENDGMIPEELRCHYGLDNANRLAAIELKNRIGQTL